MNTKKKALQFLFVFIIGIFILLLTLLAASSSKEKSSLPLRSVQQQQWQLVLQRQTTQRQRRRQQQAATLGFCAAPLLPRTQNKTCKATGSCETSAQCCSDHCIKCEHTRCQGDRCGLPRNSKPDNARQSIYTFYYPWYGSKAVDGEWTHWNSDGRDPEADDLPSPFYPLVGPYSSSDKQVLNRHMSWMRMAGIGVVVTSWWGINSFEDERVWDLLDAADDYNLKVAFYVEPYSGGYRNTQNEEQNEEKRKKDKSSKDRTTARTPVTAMEDVKYLINKYGCHRAVHRINDRMVFLFFGAREYNDGDQDEWKLVWDKMHNDKRYNPIVITQDTDLQNRILPGGWDGGHDYGCQAAIDKLPDWPMLAKQYESAGKLFFFTTCPGFDLSRFSPGHDPVLSRDNGQLYQNMWDQAIEHRTKSSLVVITAFNEWHAGASIEPVIPKAIPGYQYQDYEGCWGMTGSNASFGYIQKTREFSDKFRSKEKMIIVFQSVDVLYTGTVKETWESLYRYCTVASFKLMDF